MSQVGFPYEAGLGDVGSAGVGSAGELDLGVVEGDVDRDRDVALTGVAALIGLGAEPGDRDVPVGEFLLGRRGCGRCLGRGLAGGIGNGGRRTRRGRLRRGSQGERGKAVCREDDEQDCEYLHKTHDRLQCTLRDVVESATTHSFISESVVNPQPRTRRACWMRRTMPTKCQQGLGYPASSGTGDADKRRADT